MEKIITVCEYCLNRIESKLVIKEGKVFIEKECDNTDLCRQYSPYTTLISSDPSYYQKGKYLHRQNGTQLRKPNMCIIEVTEECDMRCTTCIADSFPGAGKTKSIAEISDLIEKVENNEPTSEILMLSGGEPTIHPNFEKIVMLACESKIEHVMLITNGKRLSEDVGLSNFLSRYKNKLEVYLQFDSLRADVLCEIRGDDLSEMRYKALSNLEHYCIPTTLVCVVKKNLNDREMPSIINYALQYNCIRGVTFQPIRATGRHSSFSKNDSICLSEINSIINEFSQYFKDTPLNHHPVNPAHVSIGYINKGAELRTLKNITTELLYGENNNCFRREDFLTYMFFLPSLDTEIYRYYDLFRVTVVEYMDKYNFDFEDLSASNICVVTPDKGIIPLEQYYLFS